MCTAGACLFLKIGVLFILVIEMKTYTICGSMRFEREMQKIVLELETKHRLNILQCIYNPDNITLSAEEISVLTDAHYRKIDISDGIYVVDIEGYIGQSVKKEIAYAQKHNKGIIYHSKSIINK